MRISVAEKAAQVLNKPVRVWYHVAYFGERDIV
jgi:hypothetical protein